MTLLRQLCCLLTVEFQVPLRAFTKEQTRMRTLHQQAPAYRRNSLLATAAKHSPTRESTRASSPDNSNKLAPATGGALSSALSAGFSALFVALLFCLLTDAVPGIVPSLLLSGSVGLTAFCLGLAFAKGGR